MKVTGTLATTVGFFFPLPAFVIEGNAKLHLDVSKEKCIFFPSKSMEPCILPTDPLEVQEHR